MGYLETLRLTNRWRTDRDILLGLYQTSRSKPLIKWMRSVLMPNNVDRFAFAIIAKETGEPIGADVITLAGYRSACGSIALHDVKWRGKGVVLETRAKLINHFFKRGGVERFFGSVDGRNMASLFNYQRLGFDHAGTWHRHRCDPESGEVFDLVQFEMFRDKWNSGPWSEISDDS
jgi:RimJ/RimL family protein N-acetyltransferase